MTKAQKCYGLSISRANEAMALSWKRGSNANEATADEGRYAAQRLHFYIDFGGSEENSRAAGEFPVGVSETSHFDVSRTDTTYSKTLNFADWVPARPRTMKRWGFSVEASTGAIGGSNSATSEIMWFSFFTPYLPELTADWAGIDNQTEFTFSADSDSSNHRPVVDVQVQTALATVDSNPTWVDVSTGALEGTYTPTETLDDSTPHKRMVRARTRGIAGCSNWVNVQHVYAIPWKPSINTAGTGRTAQRDWVQWNCDQNKGWRPVDKVLVQRAICTPQSNGYPDDGDWTTEATVADVATQTRTPIEYSNNVIADDEAVFVRVVAVHDNHEVASDPYAIAHGKVAAPGVPTVTWSGRTATITWRHNSDLTGSKTRVLYRSQSDTKPTVVGEFDSSITSTTFTIPASDSTSTVMFGTVGICPDWFSSSEVWQTAPFNLPDTPANFAVAQGYAADEAALTWTLPESTITDVQVAWSDIPTAWWSTEQPDTYNVGRRVGSWRVSGLDLGTTYYFRVRFANSGVWGEWSELVSYTPRTVPDLPLITLDDEFVKWGATVGMTWTYSNEDGSELRDTIIQRLDSSLDVLTFAVGSAAQSWQQPATMTAGAYSYRVKTCSVTGEESAWSEWARCVVVGLPASRTLVQQQRDASNESSTTIVALPTFEVDGETITQLTRLPLYETFSPISDPWWSEDLTALSIALTSDVDTELPDGTVYHGHAGDVVYQLSPQSNAVGKSWYPFAAGNAVALYPQLIDGASYKATFHVVRTPHGSERVVNKRDFDMPEFQVKWAHQAHAATSVTVNTGGTIPAYGATVSYTASSADYSTDRHDIYRVTADGLQLLRRDATAGVAYLDPYAPLGKVGAAYRVVTVTESGDYAWVEKECSLDSDVIVIDWDAKRVYLPLDIGITDTWEKPFSARRHRGGTITGAWNPGAAQSGAWSTNVVRIDNEDDVLLLRELAKFTGECYVRAPQGVGYAANVDVSLTRAGNDSSVNASLTITRIDSDGFKWSWLSEWS